MTFLGAVLRAREQVRGQPFIEVRRERRGGGPLIGPVRPGPVEGDEALRRGRDQMELPVAM